MQDVVVFRPQLTVSDVRGLRRQDEQERARTAEPVDVAGHSESQSVQADLAGHPVKGEPVPEASGSAVIAAAASLSKIARIAGPDFGSALSASN